MAGNETAALQRQPASASEMFTSKVLREFGSNVGQIQATEYQRQLIQGYFVSIDRALKMAEQRRLDRNEGNSDHKYDNNDPITWNTVDLTSLALDVVHYARMGLDMMQPNHLSAIPFKDNHRKTAAGTAVYTVNLMPGYNGIQYIAEKYALEKPQGVTVELVYSTDSFRPIKKSRSNDVEGYEFEVNNAFNRGEVVGGFGYIEYADPKKNKLVVMSRKDIEKRKPQKASAEFWGGKKTEWQNGKKVEVESDGWFEEMCLKTLKREVYSAKNMPRDPKKIDDNYQYMRLQELRVAEMEARGVIEEGMGKVFIDLPDPGGQAAQPALAAAEAQAAPKMSAQDMGERKALPAEAPPAAAATATAAAPIPDAASARKGPGF